MRYEIKRIKLSKWQLTFATDIPPVEFKTSLPLLIDNKKRVLAGNSLRSNYDMLDDIECIVVNEDEMLASALYDLEKAVAEENSIERYYSIQQEIIQYLKDYNDNTEVFTLFELPKETRFITKENYNKPNYEYKKYSEKNEEEDDDYATLFSYLGDE